jgi:hypothetical protein
MYTDIVVDIGRRGHDGIGVGFTITCAITKVVSSNPVHDEVYSIQHYVIKFVSDFRQVDVFFKGTLIFSTNKTIFLIYSK